MAAPSYAEIEDTISTEVHACLYRENRVKTWIIASLAVVIMGLAAGFTLLALRRPDIRYIRLSEAGQAESIQYNDLRYTPEDGEIRTFLWQWATYRYSQLRAGIKDTYRNNYYFLETALDNSEMARDLRERKEAKIITGENPESTVRIQDVNFPTLETYPDKVVAARGTAQIRLTRIFNPNGGSALREEEETVDVSFYLSPQGIIDRAKKAKDPMYEIINPLGLVITYFKESPGLVKK